MASSIASSTLEKARYFLSCAAAAEADPNSPRITYAANLEAAIIYGHAIWDHLRAEFGRHPQSKKWLDTHHNDLLKKPLFQFISLEGSRTKPQNQIGLRHFLIHRGGERVTLSAAVNIFISVASKVSVHTAVIRALPWYRRSLKTLYEDATYPLRDYFRNVREQLAARREQRPQPTGGVSVSLTYYFDDAAWRSKPALEIVGEYLNMMGQEVTAAERDFT